LLEKPPRTFLTTRRPQKAKWFLMGVPLLGGLLDSVVGILTGTVYGISPQVLALLSSLGLPV
jgi:hypothetical protein